MKFRTKMMITFVTVIIVPVALFMGTVYVNSHTRIKIFNETFGTQATLSLVTGNVLEMYDVLAKELDSVSDVLADGDAALLEDKDYLDTMAADLSGRSMTLIITRGDQISYSSGSEDDTDIVSRINPTGERITEPEDSFIYVGGTSQSMVAAKNVTFADGTTGCVYVMAHAKNLIPEQKSVYATLILIIIFVLGTTAGILLLWLYASMLRPLANLSKATREIKKGNLDFVLDVSGRDEISELCMDFEAMRRKLKDNAEEKMQSDAENKILIRNISHDLKTPMTSIKGYCEGIMDGVASTPEKLDKYIRTIYNKANDMDRLIDELTLYSRIDTNRAPYNFTKIHVNEYFGDCIGEVRLDLEAHNIDLAYFNYISEDDVIIIGDPEHLKRVINNIISNSVKYMDNRRGRISIRIRDAGDFVQVEIEDNGRGISSKDLPYVFDRFYRADASRNTGTGGSGIGLSIVKKIIEDHGGRIWVTSKEGTGTVMHFVIRKYIEPSEVPNEQDSDNRRRREHSGA